MIQITFLACATEVEAAVLYTNVRFGEITYRFQVESPDLMNTSHRNKKSVSVNRNYIPRAGECLHLWILVAFTIESFFSCPYHREHLLLG